MLNKIFKKLKWHRIGYIEGCVKLSKDAQTPLNVKGILYVRDPFLWFSTRKVVEIGDIDIIKRIGITSANYRFYKQCKEDWLMGGKIPYMSENGTSHPAKIIKLVKK